MEAQLPWDHGPAVEPDLIHRALRATFVGAGVDIDYDSPDYGTPLQLAAYLGDKDKVEQLLRLGADPNIVTSNQTGEAFTKAELAEQYGNDDVYDLLKAVVVSC